MLFISIVRLASKQIAPPRYEVTLELSGVLHSEAQRYNNLLSTIRSTLRRLLRAQQGLVPLTPDLEVLRNELLRGKVPIAWYSDSHPSLKLLAGMNLINSSSVVNIVLHRILARLAG